MNKFYRYKTPPLLLQYAYEHFYGRASLGQVVNIVDDRMMGTPGPSGNPASQGASNTRNTGMGSVGPGVQVVFCFCDNDCKGTKTKKCL